MSSRNIQQIKRLNFIYSDVGGSSRALREYLLSTCYQQTRDRNPMIDFKHYLRRNGHPFISALYINGYVKDMPLRKKTLEEIIKDINELINSCEINRR